MFYTGQMPTADELSATVGRYVTLTVPQSVVSSIALTDSSLIIPVNGLSKVEVGIRYTTAGGGWRWAWRTTGTVSCLARDTLAAGATPTGSVTNLATVRYRQIATPSEEYTSANYDNVSTHLLKEWLILDGSGELVFRFGQQASNAGATVLHQNSYGIVQRLRSA